MISKEKERESRGEIGEGYRSNVPNYVGTNITSLIEIGLPSYRGIDLESLERPLRSSCTQVTWICFRVTGG